MKKYKHKITGTIAEDNNYFMCYAVKHDRLGEIMIPREIIENSNDWEEILVENTFSRDVFKPKEEPNYLITAFRETKYLFGERKIAAIDKDGLYGGWHTLEGMLKNPPCVESNDFEIYSVKNSKGEEFTIGDKINASTLKNATIKSFKIIDKSMVVYCDIKTNFLDLEWCSIAIQSPIYTTTDNNAIFKGDSLTLFLLRKPDNHCILPYQKVDIFQFSERDKEVADRYLTFTSEENRDKYIKENSKKPIFVSADGKEIFEGDTIYHFYKPFEYMMHKSIARHNTIYGDVVFYTEEKAKEYIDNNKPKYSLADIEKAYNQTQSPTTSPLFQIFKSELKKLGK